MRTMWLLACGLIGVASLASGGSFSPAVLKISAPPSVRYDFDGKRVDIPVTVSGTPAGVILCIFTKDQGAKIGSVENGFLGWHYVNKIDTSVYISPLAQFGIGSNVIAWEGKNDDGALVPAGTYAYYIFGYDNISPKKAMNVSIKCPAGIGGNIVHIQEYGVDGKALSNPVFYATNGTQKWVIGNDPADSSLIETTAYTLGTGYSAGRTISFAPKDNMAYFLRVSNVANNVQGVRKMNWVPNGVSTFDYKWGVDGMVSWQGNYGIGNQPGTETIGDVVISGYCDAKSDATIAIADLYLFSIDDGSQIKKIDLTDWWADPDNVPKGGRMVGGPGGIDARHGLIVLNANGSCIRQIINPLAESEDDLALWVNGNGDYLLDKNFNPDAARPWVCNDFNVGPYTYNLSPDDNLFCIAPAYDMGAVSFGLLAPDGDGIGYFPFSGETAGWKWFNVFVDSGSAFDGIYCDNQSSSTLEFNKEQIPGVFFIAHESIKGTISNQIGVAEAAPSAFTVAQNTPNPFNPSTTISFTLVKAGKTTVEVFNAAGQKVDTILNAGLRAGNHSVIWNASRFSAGVYFYTVRSGGFTRTMKMTLVR